MKTPLSGLVAGLLLSLLAGCASTDSDRVAFGPPRFLELPLEEPVGGWNFNVQCGDSREGVLSVLGRPDATLGADLWIYRNCRSFENLPGGRKCDTLLVAFAEHRVSRMKLVNGEDLREYLDRLPRVHPAELVSGPAGR